MIRSAAILVVSGLLLGCAVPPKATPVLNAQAPVVRRPDTPVAPMPQAQWWKRYRDPQLDQLIEQALQNAPGISTARARTALADAGVRAAAAQVGARLSADAGIARQRLSETRDIIPIPVGGDWYTLSGGILRLDMDFDWWGQQRATVEAELDRARAASLELAAARMILSAAVTTEYLGYQLERQRAQNTSGLLADYEKLRTLNAALVNQGIAGRETVEGLDQQLAELRVANALAIGRWQLRQHALAALLGVPFDRLPQLAMRSVDLSAIGIPSDAGLNLVARRADVLASRWRVEAALRDSDVSRTDFYPNLRIAALVGLASTDPSELFSSRSRVASLGAAIHLPIFDLKRLRAAHGVRTATLELAVANYHEAVNAAGQEVSLQVTNQSGFSVVRQHQWERERAAMRALEVLQQQYDRGLLDAQSLLLAQAECRRARDARLMAEIELSAAQVAITKALGGGFAPDDAGSTTKGTTRHG